MREINFAIGLFLIIGLCGYLVLQTAVDMMLSQTKRTVGHMFWLTTLVAVFCALMVYYRSM